MTCVFICKYFLEFRTGEISTSLYRYLMEQNQFYTSCKSLVLSMFNYCLFVIVLLKFFSALPNYYFKLERYNVCLASVKSWVQALTKAIGDVRKSIQP